MTAAEHSRVQIQTPGQHPLRHTVSEIAYSHPALPGVTNLYGAMGVIMAVLYPNAQEDVANVAALPAVGNTLHDYRIVLDDGDGKAAGYRWEQREGDAAAKWYKVADWDWSADSIVSGMYNKTLYHYVHKWGFNDIDDDGVELAGADAGQHVYGGASANTHLTLHANAGDGVGAQTGYVQVADNVRPTVDGIIGLGTAANRFAVAYIDEVIVGATSYGDGVIDAGGLVDFLDNDLTTTGVVQAGTFAAEDGTALAPSFTFGDDVNLGLYRVGADELGVTANGARVGSFGAGFLDLVAGTAGAPSLRFGTANTGLYAPAATSLGFATGGVERVTIGSTGNVLINSDDLAVDAGNNRIGFGIAAPEVDVHLYRAGQATTRLESRTNTAASASVLQFHRSRAAGADLAASDDVGMVDAWGMVGSAYVWLAGLQARYRGDGSTQYADWIWSTANGGNPAERMRLRYDGNLGIGVTDPTSTLHVAGTAAIDNLGFDGNTISSSNVNGDIVLDPNGTGVVSVAANLLPSADAARSLGLAATRWTDLFLSGSIGDGTNSITIANLLTFRAVGAPNAGDSLFWDGDKWVASNPDSEISHGDLADLGEDDHTQYVLLAGRTGGQVIYGGTAAGNSLTLRATSNATLGRVLVKGDLAPDDDGAYQLGTNVLAWTNLYMTGQAFGLRVENYTTAGRPSASAGTQGRLYWDTTVDRLYADTGGAWLKIGGEKAKVVDTTGWDGVVTQVDYDVTGLVLDARECIWALRKNGDDYLQTSYEIRSTSATNVRVTTDIAPAAGTYTLLGVG